MPKQILILTAIAALACQMAVAALDLTPIGKEYASQGFTYVQLSFKDDTSRIAYNPPLNWTYNGSAERLRLAPANKSFAEATVGTIPGAQPLTSELEHALAQQAMAEVPPGSQAVEFVKQAENTVLIDGHGSFEVVLSYKTLGEAFRRSIVFVKFGDLTLAFRLTARAADFDALRTTFHSSLGSWHLETRPVGPITASK
jgi:hypothetical protein